MEMIVFNDIYIRMAQFNMQSELLCSSQRKCFLCEVNISSFDMQTFVYFKHLSRNFVPRKLS